MKKLIITADDFGMCQSVNNAIIKCIESGVVLSTNVMVNMEFADQAAQIRKKFPNLSVGLHLNFTVGKPILQKEKVKTLVNDNGVFHTYKEFRRLYHLKRISNSEIIAEIKAQYDRFSKICGKPDYWNTHENVHVAFYLYQLFADTCKSLNIYNMRSHQRIYLPPSDKDNMSLKWHILNPVKTYIIDNWQNQSLKKAVKSPDGLIVCLNDEDRFDFEYMCKNIEWGNKTIGELTIHPATQSDGEHFGNITEKRVREYKVFSNADINSVAYKNKISICNFEEINK